jgi:LmbE family N-acetylglucosaminyl deacetylase
VRPGRVLAVFAHPDDESLLAGGTLAACADAGMAVTVLSLTRGERGPIEGLPETACADLGALRERELQAAASELGATAICWDLPDGELQWIDRTAVAAALARFCREYRADVVITFGAEGWYWHPDHIAVHELVREALANHIPEGHRPLVYGATWPQGHMAALAAALAGRGIEAGVWGLDPADFGAPDGEVTLELDVRPFLGQKLRAVRCHRSQLSENSLFRVLPDDLAEQFLGREFFVPVGPAGPISPDPFPLPAAHV